jgi:transcriptional regulator with XRE-family HTH domain
VNDYGDARNPDRSGDLVIVKDAELLRRLMQASGVTARQLARDMGWASHSYLNRILAGKVASVRPATAQRLSDLLQVPVALLFVPDRDD